MIDIFVVRIVGGVMLLLGIALAISPILAVERELSIRGTIIIAAVAPMVAVSLISAFCLLVGCRLLFSRPTGTRSILSPTGWLVLAISFDAIAFASIAAAASSGKRQLLVVAVGFGVLGYASAKARKLSRLGTVPSRVFPPETSLLNMQGFLPDGFHCGVEILNDDRTPMEFVVTMLQDGFGLNRPDAIRIMIEIHKKGGVLLPLRSREQSSRVAELNGTKAREHNYALVCRAVHLD